MAFSDFTTLKKVKQQLGLDYHATTLFVQPIQLVEPGEHLLFDLGEAKTMGLLSEKAKSELLITPVLREVRRQNIEKISYLSGMALDTDGLSGICDFILLGKPWAIDLQLPIFCLVEAKNRTLEEGFGQCAAEMYAATLYNKQEKQEVKIVHGAVTNGLDWAFLQFDGQQILVDTDRYTILKISELLGVFQRIIDQIGV